MLDKVDSTLSGIFFSNQQLLYSLSLTNWAKWNVRKKECIY